MCSERSFSLCNEIDSRVQNYYYRWVLQQVMRSTSYVAALPRGPPFLRRTQLRPLVPRPKTVLFKGRHRVDRNCQVAESLGTYSRGFVWALLWLWPAIISSQKPEFRVQTPEFFSQTLSFLEKMTWVFFACPEFFSFFPTWNKKYVSREENGLYFK